MQRRSAMQYYTISTRQLVCSLVEAGRFFRLPVRREMVKEQENGACNL